MKCKQLCVCILFSLFSLMFAEDLDFVQISGTSFQRKDNSGNYQTISVSNFLIADRLITVEEWRAFLHETHPKMIDDWQKRMLYTVDDNWKIKVVSDNWPAFNISWYLIIEYCNWLSKKDGLQQVYNYKLSNDGTIYDVVWNDAANGYRLPTEAEWELASGVSTDNPKEDDYLLNSWLSKTIDIHAKPHDVKGKSPNKYGLYDLFGIVCQYCWDLYNEKYFLSSEIIDPKGPAKFFSSVSEDSQKEIRVVRGASWLAVSSWLVKEPRSFGYARDNNGIIGFRLVKNMSMEQK